MLGCNLVRVRLKRGKMGLKSCYFAKDIGIYGQDVPATFTFLKALSVLEYGIVHPFTPYSSNPSPKYPSVDAFKRYLSFNRPRKILSFNSLLTSFFFLDLSLYSMLNFFIIFLALTNIATIPSTIPAMKKKPNNSNTMS